jgi:hypothetical protein
MGLFGRKKDATAVEPLIKAIVAAAYSSAASLKPSVVARYGEGTKDADLKWIACVHEFAAFYMHQMNRIGFSTIGSDRLSRLQNIVGPAVAHSLIEAMVGHWPDDLKANIRHEFFGHVNTREIQYGACTAFFLDPQQDPFVTEALTFSTPKSLVNTLAVNLGTQVFDGHLDMEIYADIVETLTSHLKQHDMKTLVEHAGAAV